MADNILSTQAYNADSFDIFEDMQGFSESGFLFGGKVDLCLVTGNDNL